MLACFVALATSDSQADGEHPSLTDIVVQTTGFDSGGEFCSDFHLLPPQVEQFFQLSLRVEAQDSHTMFEYLPCYVRGTAKWNHEEVSWEIRAGGTGSIATANQGTLAFGCADACDALFSGH